ncbi:MAG: hypothetical protein AAFQ82_11725 [Myxococcota bacterium]
MSIIIAVRNAKDAIATKLENTLALQRPECSDEGAFETMSILAQPTVARRVETSE